jgi:F420-dependent oxidoreductase-like protein
VSLKVGVMFDAQEGLDWEGWTFFAEELEELGYESVWSSDHLVSLVGFPRRPRVDAWTVMTWLATATKRLRFGPMVSPITWRHPSILALTAASVDVLSGGRLEVGIGAAWNEYEHQSFGVPMPPTRTRFDMLEESAQVLRLLWTQEEASFGGEHFTLDRAHAHPRPVQQPNPRLVIGGTGERRTIPIVARRADEWNAYGLTPETYRAKRAILERHCEEADRSPSEITHALVAPLAIGETEAEVRARVARLHEVFPLPLQFPEELAPYEPEVLRANGWMAGTPDQIVELVQALAAEGASRVIFHMLDMDDRDSLRLVARDVLPAVQAVPA